jgi:hypothetical protein
MGTTLYRISEEILKAVSGGNVSSNSNISINEVKIAVCQIANSLLKVEHFQVNEKLGEKIDNGSVLGWYEDIAVTSYNGKSKCTLPVKPIKLPRNMGVFGIYPKYTTDGYYEFDKEFIPLQMGQGALIKSQAMISDLLGQVGYENFGLDIIFTKDIKALFPDVVVGMRLAILDFSQYDDWAILPILPEQEWEIKKEAFKFFGAEGIADQLVNSNKQQENVPIPQQKQS